jgi:uncharacterized protein
MAQPTASSRCSWIMFQGWRNLLFYSWPVAPSALAPLLPAGLTVDEFEGHGWVSLVPFLMDDLHLRYLPPIPGTSTFPEVNLRTYVRFRNEIGVYFFSIDAASWLGAVAARLVFHLPYFRAQIRLDQKDGGFRLASARRTRPGSPAAAVDVSWRAKGSLHHPEAGSLEEFLLERYASFAPASSGHLYRGPLLHSDWQIQDAEADVSVGTLITAAGLAAPRDPVCHFSPGTDTHVCPIQRVSVTG